MGLALTDLPPARDSTAGWTVTTLGAIAEFVMGQAPPGETCNHDGVGTPFVKAGEFDALRPIIREWTTRPLKMAETGDVLICVVGATSGKLNLGADCAIGRSVAAIRPFGANDNKFIYYQLLQHVLTLRSISAGSAQGVLSKELLSNIEFLVAPLNEQQRIVAKIDELFSELDAGVASLKRARALLRKYRQAVLKAAVTGELTRNWRERHRGEIGESGAELLRRILKARRQAWEAAELKKLRAKGKPPKDDRWKQKYKQPQPPDTTGLPALPESWVWTTVLQNSSRVTDGTHQSPDFVMSGIPFIIINDVTSGRVDWENVSKWVTRETFEACTARCRPELGDVLYTAVGSYGMAIEVITDREFMFQRHIAHKAAP